MVLENTALFYGRIGHQWHAVLLAPGQQRKLRPASGQIVKYLIGGAVPAVRNSEKLFHVVRVEIGDAPVADLAVPLQSFESRHGFFEWVLSAPVQQIEIDVVGAEPGEAALAGVSSAGGTGIPRIDLAYQKHVFAMIDDSPADYLFRSAVRVHFRSVNQRHAKVDGPSDTFNLLLGG